MKLIYILLGCFFCYNSIGQITTFNKRMQLGDGNTILTSLEATDSCYYVIGFVRDTINSGKTTLFLKTDTLGQIIFSKILLDSFYTNETWAPSLQTNYDGALILSAYRYDNQLKMMGGVLKYSTQGNLVWSSFYANPHSWNYSIRPDDVRATLDSNYIIVSSIHSSQGASDIGILKIDSDGNEELNITRGTIDYVEHTPCVYVDSDNSYIIGYQQDNLSGVNINYTVRSKLEKIDSLGNSVWVYQSPNTQQIHGVNDLIKSKDGGWVIASAWGGEVLNTNGISSRFIHDGYVYKLDSARNFLWGKRLRSPIHDRAAFDKIIELEDSSLVAFGTISRVYPQPNPTHYIIHGRVVKLSPDGDSIWSREYEYLNTANSEHTIYDAERTPDGGFLICGEANIIGTGVHQQGWLLKLDEEGCLVPGCHLVSGVLPTQRPAALNLLLYPNPTTDYLNVHYYNPSPQEDLSFRVLDVQGRLLKEYKTYDQSDKTYILPVYDLEAGVYILELRQEGVLIGSEEFLKR
ncbi:T9SS type A sorting domain-containing protein [Aureispira anguillae]|uniref:T9SS type A sorting domain-containing protein n=1 Tax=Aureispira anguillae TaxID=2864201 RepID=A0A915YKM2_9BACT|nr:T9SS type A sorting domain-containing protein [Aureispira anguillae]BDS14957.1 T9SS type A sorting domain-containing protein [Aureispira anguillae]